MHIHMKNAFSVDFLTFESCIEICASTNSSSSSLMPPSSSAVVELGLGFIRSSSLEGGRGGAAVVTPPQLWDGGGWQRAG